MPKYLVHFRQGGILERDDTGSDFDHVEHAYLSAYDAAISMWPELLRERRDPRQCAFEVMDIEGRSLFTLPFSELLDSCRKTWSDAARRSPAFQRPQTVPSRAQKGMRDFRQD